MRLPRPVVTGTELIPGLLAVAVFIAWDTGEAGYPLTVGNPGALFMLGLLVVTAVAFRTEVTRIPRLNMLALAFLAAFTLWSFVSITWADVGATAWDGANRTLLYVVVFALFTIPRWRPVTAIAVLGVYSLGVAAVAIGVLVSLTSAADPEMMFTEARLVEPIAYPNAVAGLFAGACWPAFFLASRRETPWPLRGLFLAAGGTLVEMALIPQSRGAFIVFPLALLIYIAIVPNRVRSALVLVPAAVTTALAAPALLDVFTAVEEGGDLPQALDSAGGAIAASALALAVIGAGLGFADARLTMSPRAGTIAGRVVGAAAAVAAAVGIVLVIGVIGNPVQWADERWEDFKGGSDRDRGGSRLAGDLGTERYDFWRVAIGDEFSSAPLAGAGVDNFAVTYLRERDSLEEPLYSHSLPIGVLAGTGIVGGVLFVGFLGFAIGAAARVRRGADRFGAAVSAVAIVTFGYWFMHASGDWFWSYPGLTAPAVAAIAIAGRIRGTPAAGPPPVGGEGRGMGRRSRIAIAVVAAAALVTAVASLVLPWAAARDVESAEESWRDDPADAFDRLDRARSLNFMSSEPDVVAAAIAGQLDDPKRMRAALTGALEREPTNWYALVKLGTLDAVEGRRRQALRRLRQAEELNPREQLIRRAIRRAGTGRPLTPAQLDRAVVRRVCLLVGRTSETQFCD